MPIIHVFAGLAAADYDGRAHGTNAFWDARRTSSRTRTKPPGSW